MRGRRLGAPRTARAAVVYEAMRACGASATSLADRLRITRSTLRRWLDGDARATAAFSLDALWDALGVPGERRERLTARIVSSNPARAAANGPSPAAAPISPERARAELVRLLRAELRARSISDRELARRLAVAPTTVTRLLNGAVAHSRLRIDALCDAIGLGEGSMRRRELLRLAAAGALALTIGAPPTLRARGLDLNEISARLARVDELRASGQVMEAWSAAQEPELRRLIRRARALERDASARASRFRYDFTLASLQEMLAPWSAAPERHANIIQGYVRVQEALLRSAYPREVSHELAQIHERIAPLYREMGDYDASVWSFRFALEQRMERTEDLALAVHLWRNRAHIWAVRGDERRWREDLDAARGVIARLPGDMRDELYGLVTYSEGEGYKRLAELPGLTVNDRLARARRAHDTLARSLTMTRQQWVAHEVTVRLSIAQTLVWLDPAAALDALARLEPRIGLAQPAHLNKLRLTRATVRRALGA